MSTVLIFSNNPQSFTDAIGFLEVLKQKGLNVDKIIGVTSNSANIEDIKKLGFQELYLYDSKSTDDQIAKGLYQLVKKYSPNIILSSSSKTNNSILAYLSGLLSLPMLTEISDLLNATSDTLILSRSVLAGRANSIESVKLPAIITITPKKFTPSNSTATNNIKLDNLPLQDTTVKIVEVMPKKREGVKIEDAEIVVGVGRGFKSKDDLKLAFELASLLGGEVGCSRPIAADLRWLPEDRWIGISMKKIRPKLYIAVGISGAPQHMSAVDAKIIVAINKDKNAPIFSYADYGIVADLYQFLPILIDKLKKK